MNWLYSGKKWLVENDREPARLMVFFLFFFAWNHGCLSLFFYHWNWSLSFTSSSGMFLFFKWLLASSSAAVCIWWNEHIKVCVALTKRCALAAWLPGWLAASLLPFAAKHLLKWQDRHKGPSAQESCQCCGREWAGQWSREVAWAISHVPTRVQNAQKPESAWEHNRGNIGRKTEKRKESGRHLHVLEVFYQC